MSDIPLVAVLPLAPDIVPTLVPARMINEFSYCPRLAYLEWAQGEFAASADTLDGSRVHRRVDQPTGDLPEPLDEDAEEPETSPGKAPKKRSKAEPKTQSIHARSVTLSAPLEGLTAVIDLLEGEATGLSSLFDAPKALRVTPVDYKRGAVPDNSDRAWEADRVQLCAQALILRENGYDCEEGVLYYAETKTRVTVCFDWLLLDRTQHLARELRASVLAGKIPPPLVDSPKCPRCSLVGICLPDETRLLAASAAPAVRQATARGPGDKNVRPLQVARDDARALYIQEQGAVLGKKGDVLEVRMQQQGVIAEIRMTETSHVCVMGNVQITTQAVGALLDAGIPIAYFSYGGWFRGMTNGYMSNNIELRRRQFAAADDAAVCLKLAKQWIAAKIENQRTLLRRNGEPDASTLDGMKRAMEQVGAVESLASLLGLEGHSARLYFGSFTTMLKAKPVDGNEAPHATANAEGFNFNFETRSRRPPEDPVNALLSYVYSLLTKDLAVACWIAGFDPLLGFYHQPRFGRPALALDMMEEFRAIIGDSVVLTAINTSVVTAKDFIKRGNAVALTPDGRKRFLKVYERRMDTLVTHPIFGYQLSYRRVLELQARLLGRFLFGEIETYPGFVVR